MAALVRSPWPPRLRRIPCAVRTRQTVLSSTFFLHPPAPFRSRAAGPDSAVNRRPAPPLKKRFCSDNVPVQASSSFLRRLRPGSGLRVPLRKGQGHARRERVRYSESPEGRYDAQGCGVEAEVSRLSWRQSGRKMRSAECFTALIYVRRRPARLPAVIPGQREGEATPETMRWLGLQDRVGLRGELSAQPEPAFADGSVQRAAEAVGGFA